MRFAVSSGIGSNVTGVLVSIDPSLMLNPGADLGYPLLSVSSNATGARLLPVPAGCKANEKGDGFPITCNLAFNASAVPKRCPFNPCDGLCDGVHRLVIRTDSLTDPANPMFDGLPAAGKVNGGTFSTVVIVPVTFSNGITAAPGACAGAAALSDAELAPGASGAPLRAFGLSAMAAAPARPGVLNIANAMSTAETLQAEAQGIQYELLASKALLVPPPQAFDAFQEESLQAFAV
jgi:hypothetical protein